MRSGWRAGRGGRRGRACGRCGSGRRGRGGCGCRRPQRRPDQEQRLPPQLARLALRLHLVQPAAHGQLVRPAGPVGDHHRGVRRVAPGQQLRDQLRGARRGQEDGHRGPVPGELAQPFPLRHRRLAALQPGQHHRLGHLGDGQLAPGRGRRRAERGHPRARSPPRARAPRPRRTAPAPPPTATGRRSAPGPPAALARPPAGRWPARPRARSARSRPARPRAGRARARTPPSPGWPPRSPRRPRRSGAPRAA